MWFSIRGGTTERSAQDMSFIGAYLYYFGMVTLAGKTSRRTWNLVTPNEVVRGLYVERIRRLLMPLGVDRTAVMKPAGPRGSVSGRAFSPTTRFMTDLPGFDRIPTPGFSPGAGSPPPAG